MACSRFFVAAAIGLGGTALVFGVLDAMNRPTAPARQRVAKPTVDFTVAPTPKKKIERRTRPKRQVRRRVSRPRAPLPNLSTALSGVGFGIPPIATDALAGVEDQVIGAGSTLDDVVMTARSVDQPPQPAVQVSPRYPARARAEGVTGFVKLRMLVGRDGSVVEARVLASTPRGTFDQAALTAIRKWRYRPAQYRGQPVKMWAEMVLRFDLG